MTGRILRKIASSKGQMTVELCIVLPVAIVVAAIAVNALSFFGSCAEFDRVGRNAVRAVAASPGYEQTTDEAVSKVEASIRSALSGENLQCSVEASKDYRGYEEYRMVLEYSPTLFGLGLKDEVLGVPLPKLTHESRLTLDRYKPGMLF